MTTTPRRGRGEARATLDLNNIWTDGGCYPNPGPGGWGYLMRQPCGNVVEACGGEPETTSNRQELTAVLQAMRALPDGASAVINSDSTYVVHGMQAWRKAWSRRGWVKKSGKPVPNADLWKALDEQASRVHADFRWVRGHNGDPCNERADRLAAAGRKSRGGGTP